MRPSADAAETVDRWASRLAAGGQPALLARGRRPHDDLHQRLLAGAEIGELAEHQPQRIWTAVAAEPSAPFTALAVLPSSP